MSHRSDQFPLGASITVDDLQRYPYESLAQLREVEPVSWIPALGAWLVTRRDLAVEVMRDPDSFTVDDPRFSTAAVLGQSMLSLDGEEHSRHRRAFAKPFRPVIVREQYESVLHNLAHDRVAALAGDGHAELRTALAAPMAVDSITTFLGISGVESAEVLDWYRQFSDAIVDVTLGKEIPAAGRMALDQLYERVSASVADGSSDFLNSLRDDAILRGDEVVAATAVVMFGAIETSEGMTANVLWHLLSHPNVLAEVQADRSLLGPAIEESLRLEPAAAVIDRYATADIRLGDVMIPERDLVTVSLLGANRDPSVFPNPDSYDVARPNLRQHVTFVQGPHGCLGVHLARLETVAAVTEVLDQLPGVQLDPARSKAPEGLIFRKPAAVTANW